MPGLLDVVRMSLAGTRPANMFPAALQIIADQAKAPRAALFVLDLKTGCFEVTCEPMGFRLEHYRPVLLRNQLGMLIDDTSVIDTDSPNSPIVRCAVEKHPITTADPSTRSLDWRSLADFEEGQTLLLLPMLRADTCLGMVLVERSIPFDAREIADLSASVQGITSIYDVRTQYRLLGEMRTPLDLRLPDREFFDAVVKLLVKSSGMEFIALRRLEPDGTLSTIKVAGIREENSTIVPGTSIAAPFSKAIAEKEAVSIDSASLEGYDEVLREFAPDVRSFVVAPIILGQNPDGSGSVRDDGGNVVRVFGALSLASRVEYEFSHLERLGFMSLANAIGLAIENYGNVSRLSILRQAQIEAGAALHAQEMAQGFRHEIRKKLDNINGAFAVGTLSVKEIEKIVIKQVSAITAVLDEWKSYPRGTEYRWDWCNLGALWEDVIERLQFQLGEAHIKVEKRGTNLARVEIYCSREHFMRFVLEGLILNSVDAFRERRTRSTRSISLGINEARGTLSIRYFDTAGGIRLDQVRGIQKRYANWVDLPVPQLLFEAGFTTKSSKPTGAGGGYGLHLARMTMATHEGEIDLIESGEPGAVFEIRFPRNRWRNV